MLFDQAEFDLRCEWGLPGLLALSPTTDAVVIVDVLSFSTAVDVATARGAFVLPVSWKDDSLTRSQTSYSLSPASLETVPAGVEVVLPSPNGGALSLSSGNCHTFTACLRNAPAAAAHLANTASRIAVIPAGERWPDGTLRACLEDWIGAGALLSLLPGRPSPEAEMAVAAFRHFQAKLPETLLNCSSGRELIERGFRHDVELASDYGASSAVPKLSGGGYRSVSGAS